MKRSTFTTSDIKFSNFDRYNIENGDDFTCLGDGLLGGKASGLAFIREIIKKNFDHTKYPKISLSIPRMVVIRSQHFDSFIERNNLFNIAHSYDNDHQIAQAFYRANLPTEILGDLWSMVEHTTTPFAIRSSSILEDDLFEPFAGVYATKMIANNKPHPAQRFEKLDEAIKFVYASTFYKEAKDYMRATSHNLEDEKMSVIIQEVLGQRYADRFYPTISGVAKSYNYYTAGKFKPENGIVNMALGLGKTIVDGDLTWPYCPRMPKKTPPFNSNREMLYKTQTKFWGINMGKINYDPLIENEYLSHFDLKDAEEDGTIHKLVSTYNMEYDNISMGMRINGPRILNFAPLLMLNEYKFNEFLIDVLQMCEEAFDSPVEIEFAANINHNIEFGLLQVRPMYVLDEVVDIDQIHNSNNDIFIFSDKSMGNGSVSEISDIVYVKPESFSVNKTKEIAKEVEKFNKYLLNSDQPYLLIGFGRWGSSDPWLGIPVEWTQINGAKAIIESTLPGINVDLSQGSHFFHNLSSFKVKYFSIRHDSNDNIDWNWLDQQQVINEKEFLKHIRLKKPLSIKVDGRTGKGVILK